LTPAAGIRKTVKKVDNQDWLWNSPAMADDPVSAGVAPGTNLRE